MIVALKATLEETSCTLCLDRELKTMCIGGGPAWTEVAEVSDCVRSRVPGAAVTVLDEAATEARGDAGVVGEVFATKDVDRPVTSYHSRCTMRVVN